MGSAPHESERELSLGRTASAQACSSRARGAAGVPQPADRVRKQSQPSSIALDRRAPRHAVGWMAMCLEI